MRFNVILKNIALGGIFLLPFTSLVVTNWLYFPFVSGKGFFFRVVVEIIFAAWFVLMLRDQEYRLKKSPLLFAFAALVAIMFLADIFGLAFYKSFWSNFERMDGFVTLLHLFLVFVVAQSVLNTEKLWSKFFHTTLGVGLFFILYSLLQLFHLLPINQGGVRVDGTFGNAIYLAIYMLFTLFLSTFLFSRRRIYPSADIIFTGIAGFGLFVVFYLYKVIWASKIVLEYRGLLLAVASAAGLCLFWLWRKQGRERFLDIGRTVIYALVAGLSVIILLYTATRGAVIGLAAGIFVAVLTYGFLGRRERRVKIWSISIFSAIIVLGGAFLMVKDAPVIKNNPIFGRLTSISISGDDARARFMVWNIAWQGFKDRPIFGWGQENFNFPFNKYYNPALYDREQWFDRTHNIVFDWLITGGLFGLISYLVLLGLAFFFVWRLREPKKSAGGEFSPLGNFSVSILTGLLFGYFIQNLFAFDNIGSYIFYVSFLGFLQAANVSAVGPKRSPNNGAVAVSKFLPNWLTLVASAGVPLALIVVIYFVNVRPMYAGHLMLTALHQQPEGPSKNLELFKNTLALNTFASTETREQLGRIANTLVNAPIDSALRSQFVDLAKKELQTQIDLIPNDARSQLFMAAFLDTYRRYDEARPYLEKALELSPKKQMIIIELGQNYLNQKDYPKAMALFKKAFDLEPRQEDVRVIYAVGAIYNHREDIAKSLLEPVYGTTLIPDTRVARAYFDIGQYNTVIKLWEQGIKLNPTDADRYLRLAGAYLQTGRKAEAIATIKKAVEVDPSYKQQGDYYLRQINAGK